MAQPRPIGPLRRDAWVWNRARDLEEEIRYLMQPTKVGGVDPTGDFLRTPKDILRAAELAEELNWVLRLYHKVIECQ